MYEYIGWKVSAAARQNAAQVSRTVSLRYKIHLRSGPEKQDSRQERGCGYYSVVSIRNEIEFRIQNSLKQHSVPRVWRSQSGGGVGHQGACVTKEHADPTLNPHPPLTKFGSPSSNTPNDEVAMTIELGWLQPSLVEAQVGNLGGYRWRT